MRTYDSHTHVYIHIYIYHSHSYIYRYRHIHMYIPIHKFTSMFVKVVFGHMRNTFLERFWRGPSPATPTFVMLVTALPKGCQQHRLFMKFAPSFWGYLI